MGNMISGIISITLGAVILANVFITTVKTANQSGWTAAEVSMWSLLTLVGVVGLVFGVVQVFGLA